VLRKIVSVSYNLFARLLWPRLGSIDLNGTPKLVRRALLERLDLESHDWLLDPELMIKAHYLGARVMEFNVFGRMRGTGLSHVRASTCVQFFVELLRLRFSRQLRAWRRTRRAESAAGPVAEREAAGPALVGGPK
jgi:hypothetical protein